MSIRRSLGVIWVFVLGVSVAGCVPETDRPGAGYSRLDSAVLVIPRSAEDITDDVELPGVLAGDVRRQNRLIRAAACRNILDWKHDVTIDDVLVVSTRPELVRVAELVASGQVDRSLAEAVEARIWANDGSVPAGGLRVEGFGNQLVDDYLVLRAMPASTQALDRFVVYVASASLWEQLVIYMDVDEFQPTSLEGTDRQVRYLEPFVAGGESFEFPTKQCAEFVVPV